MGAVSGTHPCQEFLLFHYERLWIVVTWRLHFMATTEWWVSSRSASLHGFKKAGFLVIDAKYDMALVGDVDAEFFLHFSKVWYYWQVFSDRVSVVLQVTFPITDDVIVTGICWPVSSKTTRSHQRVLSSNRQKDVRHVVICVLQLTQLFLAMYEVFRWKMRHAPSDQ